MKKLMRTTCVVAMTLLMGAGTGWGNPYLYTENYNTRPSESGSSSDYAALLESPNGLVYDFYPQRAHEKAGIYDGHSVIILGTGDEAFYWGKNDMMPNYSLHNDTGYLFNGYGTGYGNARGPGNDYVLGINFTKGRTQVDSADFDFALGSNSPSSGVFIYGLRFENNSWSTAWSRLVSILPYALTHVSFEGLDPIDRIEINQTWLPINMPVGYPSFAWYTMDNLTYEITEETGGYLWQPYNREQYFGTAMPVPAPSAVLLLVPGLAGVAGLRRKMLLK